MSEHPSDSFQSTVAGSYEAVVDVRKKLDAWLARVRATRQSRDELALVVTEICNNAVEHGCATAIEPMYMSGHVEDGILHMEVIEKTVDSTQSIEKALDDSLRIPALENERGRGLFLIRVYVDSLDVDMNDKGKLRIRLQKRIRS